MLILDTSPVLCYVAHQKLGLEMDLGSFFFSIGVVRDKKLLAILVWTDHKKEHDASWTLVSFDKRWCTKKVLKFFFFLAFDYFKLKRVSALTRVSNTKANSLLARLSFQKEGCLKSFFKFKEGKKTRFEDAFAWALLKKPQKF